MNLPLRPGKASPELQSLRKVDRSGFGSSRSLAGLVRLRHASNLGAAWRTRIIGGMKKSTHTPEYAVLLAAILEARTSAGLSQRELATVLDVPHSWVAKVESGERRIDLVEFCWLIRACGGDAAATSSEIATRITSLRFSRGQGKGRS